MDLMKFFITICKCILDFLVFVLVCKYVVLFCDGVLWVDWFCIVMGFCRQTGNIMHSVNNKTANGDQAINIVFAHTVIS